MLKINVLVASVIASLLVRIIPAHALKLDEDDEMTRLASIVIAILKWIFSS